MHCIHLIHRLFICISMYIHIYIYMYYMYYKKTSSKHLPWTIHSIHRTCSLQTNDPWLIAACHLPVIHPEGHPDLLPWNTRHHSRSNDQRYDHPKDDNHDDKPNAPVDLFKAGEFCCFFLLFSFEKLLAPVNFQLTILKPTLGTSWFCGKVSSLYLSKKPFLGVIQLGLVTWKKNPQKTLHKTHIYSPENEQLEQEKITSLKRKLI